MPKVQTVTNKGLTLLPTSQTFKTLPQQALNDSQNIRTPLPLQFKESSVSKGSCTSCACVGKKKPIIKGNAKTGISLRLFFLIQNFIYSNWRFRSRNDVCPICNRAMFIPADFPKAKKIISENRAIKVIVPSLDLIHPSKAAIQVENQAGIDIQTINPPAPPFCQQNDIRDIVRNINALPAMPVIAQKLLALETNSDEDEREILMLIEQDPQMSAKIIGLSNSAKHGSTRKPTSVKEAALILGMSRVKLIATGIAIMSLSTIRTI